MAQFIVETTPEEQEAAMEAVRQVEGKTISMAKLAEIGGLSQSRMRYAIIDLIEAGKVERIATKSYNKRYVRYSYRLTHNSIT